MRAALSRGESGGVVERFCNSRFDGFSGCKRRTFGKRSKLLGLLHERLELLSCVFGRQCSRARMAKTVEAEIGAGARVVGSEALLTIPDLAATGIAIAGIVTAIAVVAVGLG